jgi:hypothetical protein
LIYLIEIPVDDNIALSSVDPGDQRIRIIGGQRLINSDDQTVDLSLLHIRAVGSHGYVIGGSKGFSCNALIRRACFLATLNKAQGKDD